MPRKRRCQRSPRKNHRGLRNLRTSMVSRPPNGRKAKQYAKNSVRLPPNHGLLVCRWNLAPCLPCPKTKRMSKYPWTRTIPLRRRIRRISTSSRSKVYRRRRTVWLLLLRPRRKSSLHLPNPKISIVPVPDASILAPHYFAPKAFLWILPSTCSRPWPCPRAPSPTSCHPQNLPPLRCFLQRQPSRYRKPRLLPMI